MAVESFHLVTNVTKSLIFIHVEKRKNGDTPLGTYDCTLSVVAVVLNVVKLCHGADPILT